MTLKEAIDLADQEWEKHYNQPEVQSAHRLLQSTTNDVNLIRALWKLHFLRELAEDETNNPHK